jgi:hypothetical protein
MKQPDDKDYPRLVKFTERFMFISKFKSKLSKRQFEDRILNNYWLVIDFACAYSSGYGAQVDHYILLRKKPKYKYYYDEETWRWEEDKSEIWKWNDKKFYYC